MKITNKYNTRLVMRRAWEIRKANNASMSEALKTAWAEVKASMDAAGNRLLQIRAAIAALQAEAEAEEEILKAACNASADGKIAGYGWKASLTTYTRNQLDTKTFKADNPTLYKQYSKSQTVTRFDFGSVAI